VELLTQVVVTVGAVAVAVVPAWLKLRSVGRDARETREQTANSHQDAKYPNLRDQLDAMQATIERHELNTYRRIGDLESRLDAQSSELRRVVGRFELHMVESERDSLTLRGIVARVGSWIPGHSGEDEAAAGSDVGVVSDDD